MKKLAIRRLLRGTQILRKRKQSNKIPSLRKSAQSAVEKIGYPQITQRDADFEGLRKRGESMTNDRDPLTFAIIGAEKARNIICIEIHPIIEIIWTKYIPFGISVIEV